MGIDKAGIGGMIAGNTLTIIVAGISVAGALAFGLGGRDWAAKKLEQFDGTEGGNPPKKPAAKRKAAPKSE
jgi:hypothetical protein